jgi:electron transfer flavoprotein alpha subunit
VALTHTEEALAWVEEAMEDLAVKNSEAAVVHPTEESVVLVRVEKSEVKEVVLEAAEVNQALVVPAVVVLLEEAVVEDLVDLEEVEKSEV